MMMPYGLSRRSNFSCSIHACMILRSDGSARSTRKAASNITAFLYCSWHCLRLSLWKSYGRCRPTGGPHGPNGSCKHSKGVSSNVLQDKMFKSVEKVRGYNKRVIKYLGKHPSAFRGCFENHAGLLASRRSI